eukprot:44023_1
MDYVELLISGFVRNLETQSSTVPNDVKHLICKFFPCGSTVLSECQDEYSKIYRVLNDIDLEKHHLTIPVPAFVFFGFRSTGKTSLISHAIKLPIGVMKYGTASRCPTHVHLINNPKTQAPIITVNGEICKHCEDMNNKIVLITKRYEEQDIWSKDAIEIRIQSSHVPDLTFVDLPGLIRGDNQQFAKAKRQAEELTAQYLHEQSPDGSYQYIPVLVRVQEDLEHDSHYEVIDVDRVVDKYGGAKKRLDWRSETLFIVNQFDRNINHSPASSLIEHMKYYAQYGQSVMTMAACGEINPRPVYPRGRYHMEWSPGIDSDSMVESATIDSKGGIKTPQELWKAEIDEEEKWNQVFMEFDAMDDECLYELKVLHDEIAGISKMNELLGSMMCDVLKKVLALAMVTL